MDTLFIEQLKTKARIGVHEWEQKIRQTILIDLEISIDCAKIAANDTLEHAINYDTISQSLSHVIEQESFQLIETLAQRLADLLQNEFNLNAFTLTISKPGALANAKNVRVRLNRLL